MPFVNLQYLTVLINSIMDNIDSIEKKKAEILSDLIQCMASYALEYWPKVIGENDSANKPEVSEMYKNLHLDWMLDVISKLKEYDYENVLSNKNKENNNSPAPKRREAIYEEILDILKEIKASKQDNTMVIIVSCLATIAIIMGGFFLYRFIRRRKNSNIIENTKDLVASEIPCDGAPFAKDLAKGNVSTEVLKPEISKAESLLEKPKRTSSRLKNWMVGYFLLETPAFRRYR